jgi:hypothetical protein
MSDDSFHDISMHDADQGRAAIMPGIVRGTGLPDADSAQHRATPYMRRVGANPRRSHRSLRQRFRDASVSIRHSSSRLSSAEKADLLAFLNALTSVDDPVTLPVLPR